MPEVPAITVSEASSGTSPWSEKVLIRECSICLFLMSTPMSYWAPGRVCVSSAASPGVPCVRLRGSAAGLLVAASVGISIHAAEPAKSSRIPWPAYPVAADPSNTAAHDALIGLRASYRACLDAAGHAQHSVTCAEREYAYQAARLDRIHQKWMLLLRQDERGRFQREVRHWIAYSNDACENSKAKDVPEDCRVRAAADRAAELEARLKREGG